MRNKLFKLFLWVLGIAFLLAVTLILIGFYEKEIRGWIRDKEVEMYEYEVEKERAEYERAMKEDIVGGKTSEETFEMFLLALENNSPETAAGLYSFEKREKALEEFNAELSQNGNLEKSLLFYSEIKAFGKKKCNTAGDGCSFVYEYVTDENIVTFEDGTILPVSQGSFFRRSIELAFNIFSKVWKIER